MTSLHGLNFLRPVQRHVFVHIRSAVAHADATSATTLIVVEAEDPVTGVYEQTLRAFLTYSAFPRTSVRIAPLKCHTDEERELFSEVEHRLELQRALS